MVVADTTMIAGEGRCPLDAQIDIGKPNRLYLEYPESFYIPKYEIF